MNISFVLINEQGQILDLEHVCKFSWWNEELSRFYDPLAAKCKVYTAVQGSRYENEFGHAYCLDLQKQFEELKRQYHKQSYRNDPLAKALGRDKEILIEDASAGWGGDALRMVAMGYRVQAFERHPLMYTMLSLELEKMKYFELFFEDSSRKIENTEVIYFDPMFEEKDLKALPKKSAQFLRLIVGEQTDQRQSAQVLFARATKKLIVKRARNAPALLDYPVTVIKGKRNRFDIYYKH